MKTKFKIIIGLLFFSLTTFAQKDQVKILKKIYAKEIITDADLVDYKKNATKYGDVAIEEEDKVYSEFYKSILPILEINALGANVTTMQKANFINMETISDLSSGLNGTLDFEKKTGKKLYTDKINETIRNFKPIFWEYVVVLDGQKKYKEVSQAAYLIYQLDKKDLERLYIAAEYALRAKEYDKSIQYYNELNALKYTGESTTYIAKSKVNDEYNAFSSLAERDIAVKIGTHTDPKIEKTPSRTGSIYKNIVESYIAKNDIPGAKKAIVDARLTNPDDTSLILTEANLYLKTEDFDTYKKLITEVLAKNPNDADLFFNLGVISSKSKDGQAEAEKNYLKAIQIDPKYRNAYINLAVLKLEGETKLLDQMNKLGTSPADSKKYDVLKAKREGLYKSALPYLEKAEELFTGDADIKSTLLNVYNALDMTEKAKALKAKK
ncbi:tetratricopeptide repeat protein [Flavobacterium sp.]|uniref:tetratricopeptide repeat protein n=1 Tax=Flavobacterium sp. TaxID=239 RepID=UPI0037502075